MKKTRSRYWIFSIVTGWSNLVLGVDSAMKGQSWWALGLGFSAAACVTSGIALRLLDEERE